MNIFRHIDGLESTSEKKCLGELVSALSMYPEIEPSAELSGRIMSSIEQEPDHHHSSDSGLRSFQPWFGAAAAAAAVIALLSLRYIYSPSEGGDGPVAREQWLAECQEQDGSWNPARHGGYKVYQPALTALSALALYRSGAGYESEVERACNYLMQIQQPDGSFGGSGRESMYNQSIVTFVLAETGAGSSATVKKAVDLIKSRQSVAGGWDYVEGSEGSAAITSWHIQALAAAGRAGVHDGSVSMRKGLRWLRGLADSSGRVTYNKRSPRGSETINALAGYALLSAGSNFPGVSDLGRRVVTAMKTGPSEGGAVNLYRDCMKVRALTAAGKMKDATALKNRVAALSTDAGVDQWAKVGGRLYRASMRSLASTY